MDPELINHPVLSTNASNVPLYVSAHTTFLRRMRFGWVIRKVRVFEQGGRYVRSKVDNWRLGSHVKLGNKSEKNKNVKC